jgi:hypothetical protein
MEVLFDIQPEPLAERIIDWVFVVQVDEGNLHSPQALSSKVSSATYNATNLSSR